jgi:Ser/Thr protein kinase RdoA (MazF antagonist)
MNNSSYKNLLISSEQAENILLDLYGIKGEAQRLPGEYDMNFKVSLDQTTRYILKISRPGEDLESLHFQQELLDHITQYAKHIQAPETFADLSGNSIAFYVDQSKNKRAVRLLLKDQS